MSSEDDTDCYGLQYGDNPANVLPVKNQLINPTTTTISGSCSSGFNSNTLTHSLSNCTSPPTNTHTTTTYNNHSPTNGCSPPASSSVSGCVSGGGGNNNHLNNNRRTRQRVDAGEPRNSYSSIPNFTSRPTFMSGGLYGAIFSQTAQQHFSLFSGTGISGHPAPLPPPTNNSSSHVNSISAANPSNQIINHQNNLNGHHQSSNSAVINCNGGGHLSNGGGNNYANSNNNITASAVHNSNGSFGPVKMLNELLGRQVKQAQDATGPECNGNLIQSSTTTTNNSANLDNYLADTAGQQQNSFSDNTTSGQQVDLQSAVTNNNCINNIKSAVSGSCRGSRNNTTNSHSVDLLDQDTGSISEHSDHHNHNQSSGQPHHDHMLISSTSTPTNSQSPPALPQNANELAQHMLRNILQQSKKDLLAFDQEMQRVVANQQRQLGLDSNAVVNSSELCAMISDSAKQLTKQMVKLEMDAEEAVHNGDLMMCSDSNNENNKNVKNGGGPNKTTTISGKCLENGTSLDASDKLVSNGVLMAKANNADNNNNENNANMNVQSSSSDNEDNSMHSELMNDHHHHQHNKSSSSSKDEDIELMLDQAAAAVHNHNHNSMDGLEKRRRSSVSPIISSSSSQKSCNGEQPVALDMKRARVENIVSTMRSSPALPQQNQSAFTPTTPVNGCKKRKLYHPVQHDTAADRYAAAAAAGLNLGLNLQNLLMANSHLQQTFLAANAHLNEMNDDDMDDDQHGRNGDVDMSDGDDLGSGSMVESTAVVHQKREEKNALKSQLQSMQEQLAEMQQKYVQLCTRMEQESDAANTIHDVDDNSESEMLNETNPDDIEDLDDDDEPEVETTDLEEAESTPPAVITTTTTPLLSTTTTLSSNNHRMMQRQDSNNNSLNKTPSNGGVRGNPMVMNKMSGKMGGQMHPAAAVAAALHSQLPLGGPFGGQGNNNPLFHHLQQQHGSNGGQAAAAAAAAHELLQQQHQHQQQNSSAQQHALSNALSSAWANQKLFLEQEARNLMSKDQDEQREMLAIRDREREPRTPQNNNQSMVQRENNPHHSLKPSGQKIQDLRTMMRPTATIANQMIGPIMSGNELEGLADMLKSEITSSLSHLVDTIVTRFLHQKRFMGKQSEAAAAAAEQLSKDLMMATQLLDRKSPRTTKVADRPTGPNQSAAMFQTPKTPTSSQSAVAAMQANHNSKVAALNQVAAAALYNSMNQFCMPPPQGGNGAGSQSSNGGNNHMDGHSGCGSEQTEALPLVVQPKKKRHKVTDTRITPRTVSRILAQDGILPSQMSNGQGGMMSQSPLSSMYKQEEINNNHMNSQNGGQQQREGNSSAGISNNHRDNSGGHHQMTSPVSSTATTLTSPQPGQMSSNQGSGNNNSNQNNNGQKQQQQQQMNGQSNNGSSNNNNNNNGSTNSPMNSPQSRQSHMGGNPNAPLHLAQGFHPSLPSLPPNQQSMMPVSLPTSVAIPNPSLPEESEVFSPYSPLFGRHGHGEGAGNLLNGAAGLPYGLQQQFGHHHHHHIKMSSSPPGMGGGMLKSRDSPPLPMHHSTMLHPALLAAAHHGNSPDYASHMRHQSMDSNNNTNDRSSDCNDMYDGIQPTSATLTPMHLRKAKLMFFWVRYPSSAVLKMYFPDIRFNKNNTAQLVKWFSNFREFYYIQMEKYARQSVADGAKSADDLHVSADCEIYRVLNLHYNRNNHIEVPQNFRYVVEQTLREFYKSIQAGKDTEQSWKKSIYKIISRLDDPVPEYFKSPNFLEQLE